MTSPGSYNPQPPRPKWGIRPPPRKAESLRLPILEAPLPPEVAIPIQQCLGMEAEPTVVPGQRVRTGEPIARAVAREAGPEAAGDMVRLITEVATAGGVELGEDEMDAIDTVRRAMGVG